MFLLLPTGAASSTTMATTTTAAAAAVPAIALDEIAAVPPGHHAGQASRRRLLWATTGVVAVSVRRQPPLARVGHYRKPAGPPPWCIQMNSGQMVLLSLALNQYFISRGRLPMDMEWISLVGVGLIDCVITFVLEVAELAIY